MHPYKALPMTGLACQGYRIFQSIDPRNRRGSSVVEHPIFLRQMSCQLLNIKIVMAMLSWREQVKYPATSMDIHHSNIGVPLSEVHQVPQNLPCGYRKVHTGDTFRCLWYFSTPSGREDEGGSNASGNCVCQWLPGSLKSSG